MNRRIDLIGSLTLAVLGAAIVLYAATRPTSALRFDVIGPNGLPLAVGGVLTLLAVVQSVKTYVSMRSDGPIGAHEGTEDDEPELPASGLRSFGFMLGSFIYIAALQPVGFLLATPVALYVALTAMRYRTWRGRVACALAFTLVGYFLFVSVLSVPLPSGLLSDVLLDLGITDFN